MTLSRKTIVSFAWSAFQRGGVRILTILRTSILAHLLLPAQFGVFGVVAMSLGLLEIITETGINVILIQEKNKFTDYINTAFIVSVLRGLFIALLMAIFAPFISEFFRTPGAKDLIYFSCLIPIIRGFINPSCIRFIQELNFRAEFWYRLTLAAIETGVSLTLAWSTSSVSSFIWGLISAAMAEVIISWWIFRPLPRFEFSHIQVKNVLTRGKWVTGLAIFDYLFTQGDNITVGKLLGESSLGVYRTAYSLSTIPITEISEIYYKVSFPTFIRLKDQPSKLRRAVILGSGTLFLVSFLLAAILSVFSSQFTLLLLGPAWLEAIPIIRLLAWMGFFRCLSYSFNSVFMALGLQRYVTYIIFTATVILLICIVPFVSAWGTIGAAYSATLAAALSVPVTLLLFSRIWPRLK